MSKTRIFSLNCNRLGFAHHCIPQLDIHWIDFSPISEVPKTLPTFNNVSNLLKTFVIAIAQDNIKFFGSEVFYK